MHTGQELLFTVINLKRKISCQNNLPFIYLLMFMKKKGQQAKN